MGELEKEIAYLKRRVETMQYYLEKRDDSFRKKMHSMNLSLIPRQNLDEGNLSVLKAELANLKLGNNPTPEESQRIANLETKIAELE